MQVKALKTFNGRMGLIRTGSIITVEKRYGTQLIEAKLAQLHKPESVDPESARQPGPESDTDLGGPQSTKGGDDQGNGEDDDQDGSSGDGEKDDDQKPAETESRRGRASGSTASSSAARPAGGKAQPLSSRQVDRRSRKKT